MRKFLSIAMTVAPLAVLAQPAPPAQPATPGRTITRDQFVSRAAEMAGRRFDVIDTNHTGTITRAQLRAYRQDHHLQGPQATPE